MKITTTVRKVALMRLVFYKAPGQPDFRKALFAIRTRATLLLESILDETGGELQPQGGFRFGLPQQTVEIELSTDDLRVLDEAFRVARWDPTYVQAPLEVILWELMDEIVSWIKSADAEEKWKALPADQKKKIVAAQKKRERRKKKKSEVAGKEKKDGD